jgi:hypothetical protein
VFESGNDEIFKEEKTTQRGFGEVLDDHLLATEDTYEEAYENFSGGEYGTGLTRGYLEVGPNGGLFLSDSGQMH